jgi:hypothetical protein
MEIIRISFFLLNFYIGVQCNVIPVADQNSTNFEINPGKFQGDIILTKDQEEVIFAENRTQGRTGLINLRYRWPKSSSGCVNVPYIFDNVYCKCYCKKQNI